MAAKVSWVLALMTLALVSHAAVAKVVDIYPNTPSFATMLSTTALGPGDTVYFHASTPGGAATYDWKDFGGTYTWTGSITNPIVVAPYPGDKITFMTSNSGRNTLQVAGRYWIMRDFEIIGDARATGSLPLRLMSGTSDVVVQGMKIHDLYVNAITANLPGTSTSPTEYRNLTFRRNEIYKTAGTGECIYLGCQGSSSTTTPCFVRDSLVEENLCYDTCLGGGRTACTGGSMGSGFQVKFGSYNTIVRNNVCYNVNGPCVLLYDDWNKGLNIVEGNVVINTPSDSGIQVSAGAIIRNNIVIGSRDSGIFIANNNNNIYNGLGTRRLTIAHNTLYKNGQYGIYYSTSASASTFVNNAALGNTVEDYRSGISMATATWKNNARSSPGQPTGVGANATILVGSATTELADPVNFNVYPKATSALIRAGLETGLPYDFNQFSRSACAPTIGAYEFSSNSNPGWAITRAIKVIRGSVQPCAANTPCSIACTPGAPGTLFSS